MAINSLKSKAGSVRLANILRRKELATYAKNLRKSIPLKKGKGQVRKRAKIIKGNLAEGKRLLAADDLHRLMGKPRPHVGRYKLLKLPS